MKSQVLSLVLLLADCQKVGSDPIPGKSPPFPEIARIFLPFGSL